MLDSGSWSTHIIDNSVGVTRWMFAAPMHTRSASRRPAIAVGSKAPHGMVGLLRFAPAVGSWQVQRLADAAWIMTLEVADVDGDQDLDILYSDRKGDQSGIYWLENTGFDSHDDSLKPLTSVWKRHLIGGLGQEVMFLALAHQPNAQRPGSGPGSGTRVRQIWAAVKPNHIQRFTAVASQQQWPAEIIEVAPADRVGTAKAVAVGDLDADGSDELVFSCEGAVPPKSGVVYLKQDPRTDAWSLHDVSGPEGIKFDLVELIDLDLDGDLDILTCEERHAGRGLGVIWYANPLR
jgi:hypothetical protein